MIHLAQYVYAMHTTEQTHILDIIKMEDIDQSYQENDTEVHVTTQIYHFADGTIIEKSIEQDQLIVEVESCIERWIQYKVLQQPENCQIIPSRIEFNSACRESHWITYFK